MLDSKDRSPDLAEFVIQGITKNGDVFRPSNWGERLSDLLASTGKDGRVIYSHYLRPTVIQKIPSVVARFSLETHDPHAFELIKQFVAANHLTVRAGRNRHDAGETGVFLNVKNERRDYNHAKDGW
jgi:hypothetical protein